MVALLAASALAADLPSGAVRAGAAELAAWAGVVTSRTDASPEDTGTEEARACLPYGASLGVHPDDVLGVEVTAGLREWVTVWGAPSRSLVPEDPVTLELSHVVVAADASLLFTPVSGRLGAEGRLGFDAFLALGSGLVYTVDDVGALAKTADAERLDETAVHPALRAGAGLRLYRGPKVAVRLEL